MRRSVIWMNKVPPILISKGQDVWLADLKALNKEKYLFRGFVPVQDLISLAWAKALWATERRGIPRKWGSTPRYIWSRGEIGSTLRS